MKSLITLKIIVTEEGPDVNLGFLSVLDVVGQVEF